MPESTNEKPNRRPRAGMNWIDFVNDPRAADTIWWVNPMTDEIVTQCPWCDTQARHRQDQLDDDFHFEHKPWCPTRLGAKWGTA